MSLDQAPKIGLAWLFMALHVYAQGPSDHTLAQIKDAIRDGLRAVSNTLLDGKVVRGAGAFEVGVSCLFVRRHCSCWTKCGRVFLSFAEAGGCNYWAIICHDDTELHVDT